jgi:hypothetical protein
MSRQQIFTEESDVDAPRPCFAAISRWREERLCRGAAPPCRDKYRSVFCPPSSSRADRPWRRRRSVSRRSSRSRTGARASRSRAGSRSAATSTSPEQPLPALAPEQPLNLCLDLHGAQQAGRRAAGPPSLAARGALAARRRRHRKCPDLTTVLLIGAPDLAERLQQEVRRQGYLEWPSWARKDTLSHGRWEVSLTDPDGYPPSCATPSGTCRFAIDIG